MCDAHMVIAHKRMRWKPALVQYKSNCALPYLWLLQTLPTTPRIKTKTLYNTTCQEANSHLASIVVLLSSRYCHPAMFEALT